ncbi:MAG: hypothetical protein M3R25_11020 [Bacteroidota bacterium]|nr:hypothetical protein [Bacteroidota bacterium]
MYPDIITDSLPQKSLLNAESVYDRYSPVIYNLSLQLTSSKIETETLLVEVFGRFYKWYIAQKSEHGAIIWIIKMTIRAAHQIIKSPVSLLLERFESTPILQKMICEEWDLSRCIEMFGGTQKDIIITLQKEFSILHNNRPGYQE